MVFWGFGESGVSCELGESTAFKLNQVVQMCQHLVYKVHHHENQVNWVLSCDYMCEES